MWLVERLAGPSKGVLRRSKSQQCMSPNSWAKTCCPNRIHEDARGDSFLSKIWTCQKGRWSRWTGFNCLRGPFRFPSSKCPHVTWTKSVSPCSLPSYIILLRAYFLTSLPTSFQFEANVIFVPRDCWLWLREHLLYCVYSLFDSCLDYAIFILSVEPLLWPMSYVLRFWPSMSLWPVAAHSAIALTACFFLRGYSFGDSSYIARAMA